MGNAVGISPVLQLYKKGILVGLGTDAYTNDMLESIKVAPVSPAAQRLHAQRGLVRGDGHALPATTPRWRSAPASPLWACWPGAAADVIVMDYKPFTPFSDANIDGHMLFGMTGRQCQTTMINGRDPDEGPGPDGDRRGGRECPHSGEQQASVGPAEPQGVLMTGRCAPAEAVRIRISGVILRRKNYV